MATRSISHVKAQGKATAVTREEMRSLLMLKLVAQGKRDLTRRKSVPQSEVFRALRKRLD
jgi:hypothetical protein